MYRLFLFLLLGLPLLSSGQQATFFPTSERLSNRMPTPPQTTPLWQVTAWRGEQVATQVWIPSVTIATLPKISTLRTANGVQIAASAVQIGLVGDVWADEFGKGESGCGYRKPSDFDSVLVKDPINFQAKKLPLGKPQVLWLKISVPSSAKAGIYKGSLQVGANKLPIQLTVLPQLLPPPSQWKFTLDLWQHPAAIARVHQLPLWSKAHFEAMRPYYQQLAALGQKNITASIVTEPWGHQTFDDYPSLIRWIKLADGSWKYDYSLFDKYIAFVQSCGIKGQINCYSMVPWKLRFYYEEGGQVKQEDLAIQSAEYEALWLPFLKDFTAHLKQKGWFKQTAIAMDERPLPAMQRVIALLKQIDPTWKVALAGNYHPEIEPDITDYAVASRFTLTADVLARRHAAGLITNFYTSCEERSPNFFTFSSPDEMTWIGQYAAAKGFTGYLRWAYNSWTTSPLADSRFRTWASGDTYLAYPGPQSSIRLEKLREGIQDFEKWHIKIAQQPALKQQMPPITFGSLTDHTAFSAWLKQVVNGK